MHALKGILSTLVILAFPSGSAAADLCSKQKQLRLLRAGAVPIRYEQIVPNYSDRSVLPVLIKKIEKWGCMPNGHSFLFVIDTQHPGLLIPQDMRLLYPDEMSLILEYQFDRVRVGKTSFTAQLWFDGEAKRVIVPYESISRFVDEPAEIDIAF
ncbi:MAG: ClpXP protease specificity-enhancing factor SspB [Pseudomonadota bacterium]